jgi:hypothetical protein
MGVVVSIERNHMNGLLALGLALATSPSGATVPLGSFEQPASRR